MKNALSRTVLIAWVIAAAWSQSTTPAFEVASVKPNKSGSDSSSENEHNGTLTAVNVSLRNYIKFAYGVKDDELFGPDWLKSERYDIVAKSAKPVKGDEFAAMFQSLLAERFKLAVHRENREFAMYHLVVAKNGPKLHKTDDGRGQWNTTRGKLTATRMTMQNLANVLARTVDRRVADMTGLEGFYNFTLEWSPEEKPVLPGDDVRAIADEPGAQSIFTALQQQLGLKLESRKGPIPVLVVDHAEKVPTEN